MICNHLTRAVRQSIVAASAAIVFVCCQASDALYGATPFTLTNTPSSPNGAWSWFEDERAIIDDSDPNNPLLLVSSVSAGPGAESGDIDFLWRNLNTGDQGVFELRDKLQQDDHNSAALYIRPDGRYVAMYTAHSTDNLSRWRVSTNPHDPTSWEPEQTINNGSATTYSNIYYLPGDNNGAGRTYNFTRADNYNPTIHISNDNGSTWAKAGKLLTVGSGGDRPYVRYASDGKKIHFITTERHPRDFQNSIYHGYVMDGVLYNSDDTVIDSNLLDANGVAPSSLSTVFENGQQFSGIDMTRAWAVNLEVDNTGNAVGLFTARASDNSQDHRFFYARYDGADWRVHEMAGAGGFLYAAENDYTGLAAIDPNNPNIVYMSSNVDPRSGANSAKYELYKGSTADFGTTWNWTPITENSSVDNIRPIVPRWNGDNTAITWLQGTYSTYTNWNTEVVGLTEAVTGSRSLLWRGDATAPTSWDVNGANNWDSGGGLHNVYNEGDEVTFDDSASSYTVNLASTVTPMGAAFSNRAHSYTLAGAGVGGAGRLRVVGGGVVTLNDTDNTYTGDTLVANGKLVLSGMAKLSATPLIDVRTRGALDVTAAQGGSYTLNGQRLTIDGRVDGNIVARSNSTVAINSSNALNGDLTLDHSKATGGGIIQGDLSAIAESIILVGGDGLQARTTYTYVEANHSTNTTLADGSTLTPVRANAPAANAWMVRGTAGGQVSLANGGSFYQADPSVSGENAPALRTTVGGLIPNTAYDVQVNYWDATDTEWRIRAGRSLDTLATYDSPTDAVPGATNGVYSSSVLYNGAMPLTIEGNRTMYGARIGSVTTDSSGNLVVYVDDYGSGGDDRTWFDGLSYASGVTFTGQATMTIQGDLTLDATSTLKLDIGNQSIYDQIKVTGAASLAGVLDVRLAQGATALQINDVFQVLDCDSITGAFNTYILPGLAAGLTWDVSDLGQNGSLKVVEALPGDYNGDGLVNAADYTVWRDRISQPSGGLWGGNRNLTSSDSAGDYAFWRDNYGKVRSSGLAAGAASVPEPSAFLLLTMSGLGIWSAYRTGRCTSRLN